MVASKPVLALAGVPRVNLMPKIETDRRERASLVRNWALMALAAILAAVLIIAGAFAVLIASQQALQAEQSRTASLSSKLAGYADTTSALAQQSVLESFRAEALGNDLAWTSVYKTLLAALPSDATLTGMTMTTGVAPKSGDAATQIGLIGTFTATSAQPLDLPAIVRSLRTASGVMVVDATALNSGGSASFTYSIAIQFDQSIYSGTYTNGVK